MKSKMRVPLARPFAVGLILAAGLVFPGYAKSGEPSRWPRVTPMDMAAILRDGSNEECGSAFDAILNSGPISGEMAEVIARGMKPRDEKVKKGACIVLRDAKFESKVV